MKTKAEIESIIQQHLDSDHLVEAAWVGLTLIQPPPPHLTASEIRAMKSCYFLGADFIMQVLATTIREGWSNDETHNVLDNILKELRNFMQERGMQCPPHSGADLH